MFTVRLTVNKDSALSSDQITVQTHFLDCTFSLEGSDWAQKLCSGSKNRITDCKRFNSLNPQTGKRPRDGRSYAEHV